MIHKLLFPLLILFWSFSSFAAEDDFKMRVSWVKTLKELIHQIETTEDNKMVLQDKKFLKTWSLISEAWADARYNCFYAGWPSTLKSSGGKKLCQLPIRSNSSYEKGICKGDELQCQPLLFGKNLCVSFRTKEERNSSFSNCEKKFKEANNDHYDFLRNISREQANDLREMSSLAADICGSATSSPQKGSSICKKINEKLPDAMKAIDRGFVEATAQRDPAAEEPEPIPTQSTPLVNAEDCEETTGDEHQLLTKSVASIQKKANEPYAESYEKIKQEFLSSPFCDPEKIANNSDNKPSAVYMSVLMDELKNIEYLSSVSKRSEFMKTMQDKFNLSFSAQNDVLALFNQSSSSPGKETSMRIRGLILQDAIKNYRPGNKQLAQEMKEDLAKKNIFKKNSDGEIECPFISKDAFMKAMAGKEDVLKSHGGSIKKKNQITIVDYTRPSNERRMFVIDLETNQVLHNTWTANGIGNDGGKGQDGKGGSPEMSNQPGSLKSSDGFIIATAASHGNRFGPNVLLKGIDSNNTNLAARAVIVHGWDSPMGDYANGMRDYNEDTGKYDRPYDVIERVMKEDFKNGSSKQMEKALWGVKGSLMTTPYLSPTEGCLGVPTVNMKHLDRKGRNKDQVELLREDLPGSIIFSYSGPDMKSKYL